MKKLILTFFLLLTYFSIFSISATGYGEDFETAEKEAANNLVKELYGELISSEEELVVFKNKETFSRTIKSTIRGCLYATSYESIIIRGEGKELDKIQVTINIDPSAIDYYDFKIRMKSNSILNLRNTILKENSVERKNILYNSFREEIESLEVLIHVVDILGGDIKEYQDLLANANLIYLELKNYL